MFYGHVVQLPLSLFYAQMRIMVKKCVPDWVWFSDTKIVVVSALLSGGGREHLPLEGLEPQQGQAEGLQPDFGIVVRFRDGGDGGDPD